MDTKKNIPVGWSAFYDPETKKATGYTHFPHGGGYVGGLSILSAESEEALKALAAEQGITLPSPPTPAR